MISVYQLLSLFAAGFFILGILLLIAGSVILITRVSNKEVQTLAAQATRLAQKGLAEEVSGLVGNAASILDGLNQLTRTTTGVGVFLIMMGLLLMGLGSFLILQIVGAGQ